jgi:hypothetical protein
MNLNLATVNRVVDSLLRRRVVFVQKDERGHLRYTHIDQIDD